MQLFSSVNCNTTRVNIIVLSVILQPKTKHGWGCVKWGCRASLCDINQLFIPMKLQNIYLASWYTRPRPQKTNRHLYQRRTGLNSKEERQCMTTRSVREVWEKPVIDWQMHIRHITGPYTVCGTDITQRQDKAKQRPCMIDFSCYIRGPYFYDPVLIR